MKLSVYQIDAFAEKSFEGNPAAVIPLDDWLPDSLMQSIAEENNLAETAFFVHNDSDYHIRWFTPTKEVNLCGHATLASAFVLFNFLGYKPDIVTFNSLSGPLGVSRSGEFLTLDFPSQKPGKCVTPAMLVEGLGELVPSECYAGEDYVAVFDDENTISRITPNYSYLEQLDLRGVIVTAPSSKYEFVARFFAPKYGIPEDPVTGSAYTQLMPYWAEKLGKSKLSAKQISSRGGKLICELKSDRVLISGSAVMYLEGKIEI